MYQFPVQRKTHCLEMLALAGTSEAPPLIRFLKLLGRDDSQIGNNIVCVFLPLRLWTGWHGGGGGGSNCCDETAFSHECCLAERSIFYVFIYSFLASGIRWMDFSFGEKFFLWLSLFIDWISKLPDSKKMLTTFQRIHNWTEIGYSDKITQRKSREINWQGYCFHKHPKRHPENLKCGSHTYFWGCFFQRAGIEQRWHASPIS